MSSSKNNYASGDSIINGSSFFAAAASLQVASRTGQAKHPLSIHGGSKASRVNILEAIKTGIATMHPEKRITSTTTKDLTDQLIDAIRNNCVPDFRLRYRAMDVLLLDDIEYLQGKTATQDELFDLLSELVKLGSLVILGSCFDHSACSSD